jgi:hypothetical protein
MRSIPHSLEISFKPALPTSQSKTLQIYFSHQMKIDLTKQIISDPDAIVCLTDKAIINILDSHDTYKLESLVRRLCDLNPNKHYGSGIKILEEVFRKVYSDRTENSEIAQEIDRYIRENKGKNID